MTELPPEDPDLPQTKLDTGSESYQNDREQRTLQAEVALLENKVAENNQRVVLRWVAAFVGIATIVFMAATLWHAHHSLHLRPFLTTSPAYAVAFVVAPILSITTIVIALLIGAFPRFKDGDMKDASSGALAAAALLRGS